MEKLIQFLSNNVEIIRPIWFSLGWIGLFIFTKTRPYFYQNKPAYWWIIVISWYGCIGPAIIFFSIITLFIPEKKMITI